MRRSWWTRRALIGLAALAALGAGCGRPAESTRFVPAAPAAPAGNDRAAPAGDPDRARPEVRKIEMH